MYTKPSKDEREFCGSDGDIMLTVAKREIKGFIPEEAICTYAKRIGAKVETRIVETPVSCCSSAIMTHQAENKRPLPDSLK